MVIVDPQDPSLSPDARARIKSFDEDCAQMERRLNELFARQAADPFFAHRHRRAPTKEQSRKS